MSKTMNKKNSNLIRNLALLPVLLMSSITAQAGVITDTASFTNNNLTNYATTTNNSAYDQSYEYAYVSLDRFDSSLGTLTGVDISFTSSYSHQSYASAYDSYSEYTSYSCGSWWNSSTCRDYYNDTFVNSTARTTLSVQLTDPSFSQLTQTDYNFAADCNDFRSNGGAASCSRTESDNNNPFNGSLNLNAFSLNEFTGTGTNPIDLRLVNFATISASCDNSDNGDTCQVYNDSYWRGTITVAYTYESVPEPGLLFLLSAGLLGLGISRRKRFTV